MNIPCYAIAHLDYFALRHLKEDRNADIGAKENILDVADLTHYSTIPEEISFWLREKNFTLKIEKDYYSKGTLLETAKTVLRDYQHKVTGVISHSITDSRFFQEIAAFTTLEKLVWLCLIPKEKDIAR